MRSVKAVVTSFFLFCLLLISACNGPSDNENDQDNGGEYSLSLSYKLFEDGACTTNTDSLSFSSEDSFCAIAHLKQDSANRSGQLISFSASLGSISPETKLTDDQGLAEVVISNLEGILGAGTVSATFTLAESSVSSDKNYEFIGNSDPDESISPSFNSAIIKDGAATNQFNSGDTVQLQATLLDNQNQGIANQIVTFSAGSASLSPDTALTNASGIAQVSYSPTDTELGAATLSSSVSYLSQTFQTTSLYEVLASDAIGTDGVIKLGYFDADEQFVEGSLGTTLTPQADGSYQLSAGGSFGVTATLVNQGSDGSITRIQTPSSISFTSDCVTAAAASIDSPVTTISGTADATFQDTSCSGNTQRSDVIVASILAGSQSLTATLPFTLTRQTLASVSFISAEPANIRIKGAGGTGSSESSLVTFQVLSANGQPASQQLVTFTLDTVVGGLSFANGLGTTDVLTNSEGLASVRVLAGTVPTPVRVVASATDADTNEVIVSQSEQLTVNTGLPQQLGFSLSTSVFNTESASNNGEISTITAYASDSFGNPAPDDTTINFTSEGGQIQPSCLTVNGRCSVEWTSSSPRVSDHRITVLAYALGHETFFDTNGNNQFDDADGGAIADACVDTSSNPIACNGNGLDRDTFHENGFVDLPDAFRDDNENGVRDSGEPFFNTTASTTYAGADGLFNGPQCTGSLCGADQQNKTYIRKALVLTMSGSTAHFEVHQDGVLIYANGQSVTTPAAIALNASALFTVRFTDSANQMLPAGSTFDVTASAGELESQTHTVENTTRAGGSTESFGLTNDGTDTNSLVTLTLSTPKGINTRLILNVPLSSS